MEPKRGEARERILDCTVVLMKEKGIDAVSMEAVAEAAGSAKGLVHYHFKTKQGLFSAAAKRLTSARMEQWLAAFRAPTAREVVMQTWSLLTEESTSGTMSAWQSLTGVPYRLTDGLANKLRGDFVDAVCSAVTDMMHQKLGLIPTVPSREFGRLLAIITDGVGIQLTSGADESELEGAYSAAWLGILSLTKAVD